MKRIPRRIFTAEFKREAIKLVTEQGLTLAEAGRKLDVATKSLRTWMDQQEHGSSSPALAHQSLRQISSAFASWSESWQSRRWSATS